MKFDDRDIPKKIQKQMEDLEKVMASEIIPMLVSVTETRDIILEKSDRRIEEIMVIYEIDEYERFNDHVMNISVAGVEAKAETDPVKNEEWVVYKVNDEDLKRRIYSFIGTICTEESRCMNEILSAFDEMGLTFKEFSEHYCIVEYKGEKVSGEVKIPLIASEFVCFILRAELK